MSADPIPVSVADGYELWAGTWDTAPSPIVALERRVLLPWIERFHPRRAIDIGCGTGRWAALLSAIGVDASPAMLAIAATKPGLRGRLAVADAGLLPIANRTADLVLCALTLGHVRNHAAALRELSRILEPGGTLILSDFHPAAVARGWRRTFRHDGQVYEIETHPFTVDQLLAMAREAGLSCQETLDAAIGEPERELFHLAGRSDLFEAACQTPTILATRWMPA